MRFIPWLLVALLGGLLALTSQGFLKVSSQSNPVYTSQKARVDSPEVRPPAAPLNQTDAIRMKVFTILDASGVISNTIQVGQYPLRGRGRRPQETFPLISFTCPLQQDCLGVMDAIERQVVQDGYTMVASRTKDQVHRPLFRALAYGNRPVLALRGYPSGPRLCLVIGDVGQEVGVLDHLLALREDVTYAVLANSRHASAVSKRLGEHGREVIAHLPMEPLPPRTEDGPDFLRTSMSLDEVREKTVQLLNQVPGAVGADGHLGGRFTTSYPHIRAVLETLVDRGLFFMDGRPSDASITFSAAQGLPLRDAVRTHRIDVDDGRIEERLKAVEVSLVLDGTALVVASPDPPLLKALKPWLDSLKKRNIHLIRLSEMVL